MTEHLTIELSEPVATELRAAVEAGAYTSTSEAVQDALQIWLSDRNELRDRLRRAWGEGKASGVHGPLDFDELRTEARRRLAAVKAGGS